MYFSLGLEGPDISPMATTKQSKAGQFMHLLYKLFVHKKMLKGSS